MRFGAGLRQKRNVFVRQALEHYSKLCIKKLKAKGF